MESETPFTDSLLEWGRSGSFYPILIPNEDSRVALEALQEEIVERSPGSAPSTELHSTLFYVKPAKLYARLLEIQPKLREAWLYRDLQTTMATLLTCMYMYPFEAEVEGVDRFGPNDEMIALRLKELEFRSIARDLLKRNLGLSGFGPEALAELAQEPVYQWVFGPSDMHISLASNVGEGFDVSSLSLPTQIAFNGLGDGSVQAPGETVDERHMWYLGLKT